VLACDCFPRIPVPPPSELRNTKLVVCVWSGACTQKPPHRVMDGSSLVGVACIDMFPLTKEGWGDIDGWYYIHDSVDGPGFRFSDALRVGRLQLQAIDLERQADNAIAELHVHVSPAGGSDLVYKSAPVTRLPEGKPQDIETQNPNATVTAHDLANDSPSTDFDGGMPVDLDDSSLSEQLSQNLEELEELMSRTLRLHDHDDNSDDIRSSDAAPAAQLHDNSVNMTPATVDDAPRPNIGTARAEEIPDDAAEPIGNVKEAPLRQSWEQKFRELCFEDLDNVDSDPDDTDYPSPRTPPRASARSAEDKETARIAKILSPGLESKL